MTWGERWKKGEEPRVLNLTAASTRGFRRGDVLHLESDGADEVVRVVYVAENGQEFLAVSYRPGWWERVRIRVRRGWWWWTRRAWGPAVDPWVERWEERQRRDGG